MKKLLKLSGVSVVAIMATMGANAAGYTCEDSIEYTSCNGGYYLTDNGALCPDGYEYGTGYCDYGGGFAPNFNVSEEECLDYDGAVYMAEACGIVEMGEVLEVAEPNKAITKTCVDCPSGSYCPAGSDAPTACPAGSYCAGTKLAAPSGQCTAGSYSTAGATSCTKCPQFQYTDKDDKVVTIDATSEVGADSVFKCSVAAGKTFSNKKGTYSFKEICYYDAPRTYDEACAENLASCEAGCAESDDIDNCIYEECGECGCTTMVSSEFIYDEKTGSYYCNEL